MRITVLMTMLALLALPAAATAETRGPGAVALNTFLSEVTSLRAGFTQTVMDADRRLLNEASGTLAVLRPGRFRWDYREPYIQVIVADGAKIWMYDEELGQVTVRDLDDTLASTPAMLLSGGTDIGEHSEVRELGEAGGMTWVGLLPKVRDTEFESVRIAFRNAQLTVMELIDNFGQTTRIEFFDMVQNIDLSQADFDFVTPPGTDVIGGEG